MLTRTRKLIPVGIETRRKKDTSVCGTHERARKERNDTAERREKSGHKKEG